MKERKVLFFSNFLLCEVVNYGIFSKLDFYQYPPGAGSLSFSNLQIQTAAGDAQDHVAAPRFARRGNHYIRSPAPFGFVDKKREKTGPGGYGDVK